MLANLPTETFPGSINDQLIERDNGLGPLAKVHQHDIHGDAVKPRCEGGFTAKGS